MLHTIWVQLQFTCMLLDYLHIKGTALCAYQIRDISTSRPRAIWNYIFIVICFVCLFVCYLLKLFNLLLWSVCAMRIYHCVFHSCYHNNMYTRICAAVYGDGCFTNLNLSPLYSVVLPIKSLFFSWITVKHFTHSPGFYYSPI